MTRLAPLWQQNGEFPAAVDRRLIAAIWPSGGVSGMAPTLVTGTRTVRVAAGSAAVPASDGTGSFLCVSDASEDVDIPAAGPAGTNRYDQVVVRPRDSAISGADNDFIFDVVAGPPSATPPVPGAPPAGTIALARVYVQGGEAFLVATNLTDIRPQLLDNATGRSLAYVRINTGQGSIQTTPVDLTGLNTGPITVTSRRRIGIFANVTFNKAANDLTSWILLQITTAANAVQEQVYDYCVANGWAVTSVYAERVLDPGTYTYKLRAQTGSGFLNVHAGSSHTLNVTDLGPA